MEVLIDIIGIIGGICGIILILGTPILIVWGSICMNRYTKKQIESGEDKRIILNFAGSLFKQPENYTYAVGNYTKAERYGNTTTYYYYSYLLAFNQGEFHIVAFKAVDHMPVYRNIITFNFAEMQLTHRTSKKELNIDLYLAGEKQHITVPYIVKGTNNDKSDTPFALDQTGEVQFLEQMLMQYEARSYQMQMGGAQQMNQQVH